MKIVAIVGSPRVNGNTSNLTDLALREAKRLDIETEKVMLPLYQINPCKAHSDCRDLDSCHLEDDMASVLSRVYEADGIILASPVYFYNVTAQMKAFIDRNVFPYRHGQRMKAKCAGIIVIAGGAGVEETSDSLARYIKVVTSITEDRIFRVHGFAGAEGAVKDNAEIIESARSLGNNLAEVLLEDGSVQS